MQPPPGYDIAVVGVAGRFPGARDVAEFWRNLRGGVESITFLDDRELLAAGEPVGVLRDPAYVRAQPVLEDFDRFDARLFGFSPQDAAVMDPQHRVFLEVGWEALEDSGHSPASFPGNVGVFAACGLNAYLIHNLVNNRRVMETVGEWLVRHTGNDMNFLATRLSYELDLKGPSMNVQTACSSALVAVHLACQSLLGGECDMALAGGSTVVLPQRRGYLYRHGEILSPDGHCRAFDAKARGTLFGSGAGVVALRRLAEAVADGDRVLAVIKGSAVTNDGSGKVGYLAPGVEGQARAVTEALAISGVAPDTVGYVEAHGTGTVVGDPIEVLALTRAYRQYTNARGFCAIGSVKTNIGHLGEAAGVVSFIKAVLALKHREIPPSLHYESPNPEIDFAASPFFVNASLRRWDSPGRPRRAGVTSLGAGGTNCHVILEEAPEVPPSGPSRPWQVLLLSANTPTALETATQGLAAHLRANPGLGLADVAYTLHDGRRGLSHRRSLVCRDRDEAIRSLESGEDAVTLASDTTDRPVAFLFPGQGAQYPDMGRGLYDAEPLFRAEVDRCAEALRRRSGLDIRATLFPPRSADGARERLDQTAAAQPALFVIEYALAKLWMSWGVQPVAMAGHSVGEYVAACLAGVFPLDDALGLVADRGRLMQQAAPGAMLAVMLPPAELERLISAPGEGDGLSLAAVNGPALAVVAGPEKAVAAFASRLSGRGVSSQRLRTSHAFHSAMMDPVLPLFADLVRRVRLSPPSLPYLSNLTGTWVRPEEATDPDYWVRHLRGTVRFSDCLAGLISNGRSVLLEVGPGRTLSGLAAQQPVRPFAAVPSLGRFDEAGEDLARLLKAYGHLWASGCTLEAPRLYEGQRRRRVSLPTYPFERERYWVEPDPPSVALADVPTPDEGLTKKADPDDWFYLPTWNRSAPPAAAPRNDPPGDWLVFLDESGLGRELVERLRRPDAGPADAGPFCLEVETPGDVESLQVRAAEPLDPGPGEVEIRVRASALNFADVLKATGVFPDAPFGMECAGVIERVGAGVRDFRTGDEVVAIGPGSFRSHVVRDARLVAPKPESLTTTEAVTLPAAFMTAWYALRDVGRLRRGERVLIHAASGGVGLAAVQVARGAGAEVFATAGSPEKRRYLKSIGVRHVFDSRSLDFAVGVMRGPRGKGVDVVLNSLTGEFIPRSFALLAEGGRFLEIGKRELYSPDRLAALGLKPGVSYHAIDLTRLLADDPDAYGALLREVIGQARDGRMKPLRRHVFEFAEASRAFRLMLQTRHIGKVVLSLEPPAPRVYRVRAGKRFRRLGADEFTVRPDRPEDYLALLDALEGEPAKVGRIAHLWSVSGTYGRRGSLERNLGLSFLSLLWLAKAWGVRGWSQPIALTVVSTGAQPMAGEGRGRPEKATLLGPCGVIPREFPNVTCRTVDVPATGPGRWERGRVIEQLLAELSGGTHEQVVAYRGAERWVRGYEHATLPPATRPLAFRQGGVYLIAGGLGGLGLEFAEHLARTARRAKLVLLGRTTLPERGDWDRLLREDGEGGPVAEKIRKVRACEAAGATVVVAQADVTDRASVRGVVDQTRKAFGTIHGVIQASGTLDDGLIQLKTPESAWGVLGPKVKGTLVLDEALGDEPLDFFVLCSSVSSLLGLQGQVDYTAANAFLDAFASQRSVRRPGQTIAINWSAWTTVGMAARATRAPVEAWPGATLAQGPSPRHPWLERRLCFERGVGFATEFSRSRQWLLDEHTVRGGNALIPGTGFLELARAAFCEVEDHAAVELSRVVFEEPFAVAGDESRGLAVRLDPGGPAWDFQILSRSGKVTHVTGRVEPCRRPRPGRVDIASLRKRCPYPREAPGGFLEQSFMCFGQRWGNVRGVWLASGEALISLALAPEFASEVDSFRLHPALLDMATGGAQALIPGFDPGRDFYVPFSYGRLSQWAGLPGRVYSHVKVGAARGPGLAVFDVVVTDADGTVVAEVSEFVMRRVPEGTVLAASPAGVTSRSVSASALAAEALRQGIEPDEGVAVFERIVASGVSPQLIVSSTDLRSWFKKAEATGGPGASADAATARAPADARSALGVKTTRGGTVEQHLATIFSRLLGVNEVGPDDDFFELGGHSLLAVRLLAQIEKEFDKQLPLPSLFQSASIRNLAAVLREGGAPVREASDVIVPLTEEGEGPAFYCVHSLIGEVVSFRTLARMIGPATRFYGIQSTGDLLSTDLASSVESLSEYYVKALIDHQPEGPFLLGGWSAGSTIALEMAHRLRAAGRAVDLLIALDGAPFNTGAGMSPWNPLYLGKLLRNVPRWVTDDLLLNFSLPRFARRVQDKFAPLARKTTATLSGKPAAGTHSAPGFIDTSMFNENQVRFMSILFNALRAYVPRTYDGRVRVYKSTTEPLYHLLHVEESWAAIAPNLEVVPVRGTHVSITREPYVRAIAEDLRKVLTGFRAEVAQPVAASRRPSHLDQAQPNKHPNDEHCDGVGSSTFHGEHLRVTHVP